MSAMLTGGMAKRQTAKAPQAAFYPAVPAGRVGPATRCRNGSLAIFKNISIIFAALQPHSPAPFVSLSTNNTLMELP
ncbi:MULTISPECIES: hypothetical protein [unclassified Acidovorax]|uniref:hypothetical protein n=1 Tax=unclassified Acidovorax TaxID=2684926 RepID=UPI001C448E68|nr:MULTISPECIES: hypothetical protein [unclassified Acidovorax]MBV7430026.1 hypothetical protein [Acidovorax sp. sif0732]MBV7451419.1 hypothetical protein [Acidovorax sp. sif0715]